MVIFRKDFLILAGFYIWEVIFYGENNQKYMSKKIIIIYEIVTIEEKIECKYTL